MVPWQILSNFDIDEWAELWCEQFLNTAKEFIPCRKVLIRPKDKYFMTNYIRKLLRVKNRLWKIWNRTKKPEHYLNFSNKRNEVKNAIKES